MADKVEKLVEAIRLGSAHFVGLSHGDGKTERAREAFRDLLHGNGLELVLPVAQYRDGGRAANETGEHRDELVLGTKDERGADDGPVERARAHHLLGLPLRPVVAGNRAGSRAHRAHLNVALDTDLARYAQHVGGGLRVEAIEAHPGGEVLADDPYEMDHASAALDGCGQGIRVEHVTR